MPTEKSRFDSTECICPMCRSRHYKPMYWLGRGIPRKYCKNCRIVAKGVMPFYMDPYVEMLQRGRGTPNDRWR